MFIDDRHHGASVSFRSTRDRRNRRPLADGRAGQVSRYHRRMPSGMAPNNAELDNLDRPWIVRERRRNEKPQLSTKQCLCCWGGRRPLLLEVLEVLSVRLRCPPMTDDRPVHNWI